MTNGRVAVIDYGVGNLYSVTKALEKIGADVFATNNPAEILAAAKIILPGVGAFKNGMQKLRERGLVDPIATFAATGKPILGICLGAQMLLDSSSEFGEEEGLGIIKGKVTSVNETKIENVRIPHIGWNSIELNAESEGITQQIFSGINNASMFYFVHSYEMKPIDPRNLAATCTYENLSITAAVSRNNIIGVQFHPEKSGNEGLKFLENFSGLE